LLLYLALILGKNLKNILGKKLKYLAEQF